MKPAILAIEDGSVFAGRAVGADGESTGELVFNTSMSGYQEILTDPSYAGQIITMTCPHIGNYGVNEEDVESDKPYARGFVMRECCFEPSNWRATSSLPDYLKRHGVVAIDSVDTRHITRLLRTKGAMKAIISTVDLDADSLVAKARASADMAGSDFVKDVSVKAPYEWHRPANPRYRVVAIDYGIKHNILRLLEAAGCAVTVMPATVSPEEVLALDPDGVFLSNGPGDPAALPYVYPTVQALIEKRIPIFGICLGHQILGHALGGKPASPGHRGGNQPSSTPKRARWRERRITVSRWTPAPSILRKWTSATSTSTTRPVPACSTSGCPSSACSIIQKPRPARTTAVTSSRSSPASGTRTRRCGNRPADNDGKHLTMNDYGAIGAQSYSFRKFDTAGAIAQLQRLGASGMEFCGVHFPPDPDHPGMDATLALLQEKGVSVPAFGVEGFGTDAAPASLSSQRRCCLPDCRPGAGVFRSAGRTCGRIRDHGSHYTAVRAHAMTKWPIP